MLFRRPWCIRCARRPARSTVSGAPVRASGWWRSRGLVPAYPLRRPAGSALRCRSPACWS
eukprot:9657947-Prorocentrum_lima.AAC.1